MGQLVDVGEALLEARDGVDGGLLGFDDREFAEFDAGAGHHGAAEEVLAAGQADLVELGDDVVDFVFGDVEQEDLLVRGEPDPVGAELLGDITDLVEQRTRGATGDKARADVIPAVLLLVDAHMVAGDGRLLRCRSVGELVPEVFGFEDLAELLRAPVGEEEFHARLVPQAAVAVVTEDLGDAEPDVDGLVRGDPRAEAFGEARDDGQCTAHPQVVADSVFGVLDGDKRAVVDLVEHVLAGVPADRSLVFAGQVGQARVADVAAGDLFDRRSRVDEFIGGDAGDRGSEEATGDVAAGFGGLHAD